MPDRRCPFPSVTGAEDGVRPQDGVRPVGEGGRSPKEEEDCRPGFAGGPDGLSVLPAYHRPCSQQDLTRRRKDAEGETRRHDLGALARSHELSPQAAQLGKLPERLGKIQQRRVPSPYDRLRMIREQWQERLLADRDNPSAIEHWGRELSRRACRSVGTGDNGGIERQSEEPSRDICDAGQSDQDDTVERI